jgi:chemotaxis protein CheD
MPSPSLVGFEHKVIVGVGEMAITNNPNLVLTTYSLGSCLGITIYDPVVRVGGLLHVMLPDSSIDTAKASAKPAMFVDTGIPALFRSAYELHAVKQRMLISVVGGAQIMDNAGYFNIGTRTYEAVAQIFQAHNLRIIAEEVGGLVNRTLSLRLSNGQITLKTSGQTQERLLWTP